jgi:hypothetical protein
MFFISPSLANECIRNKALSPDLKLRRESADEIIITTLEASSRLHAQKINIITRMKNNICFISYSY